MKIVDLRPMMVRRFARSDNHPRTAGFPGRLAGFVSDAIIRRKVSSRPRPQGGPLLVSVGNLALGGTGKTPVVMALARDLAAAGLKGAILTRGYGSSLAGPLIVDPADCKAGDEARMMAQVLAGSGWPVVQSRNRPAGLDYLRSSCTDLQVVLLEDAFQTAQLARHIDLVILDSWEMVEHEETLRVRPLTGSIFPFGPWRETARGAGRASALLIEGNRQQATTSLTGQPVFYFERFVQLRKVQGQEMDELCNNWALLSGIARPEKFENSARELLDGETVLSIRCQDHAQYTAGLVLTVLKEMEIVGAAGLVTTAKDWVKLSTVWTDSRPVVVLDMDLQWEQKNALHHWLAERVREQVSDQSESTAP